MAGGLRTVSGDLLERWAKEILILKKICAQACAAGLMHGWSGNASLRLEDGSVLITASGINKRDISANECVILGMEGHILAGARKPSSEWRAHMALYAALPQATVILHTHPVHLQALELVLSTLGQEKNEEWRWRFLNINIFEAEIWRDRLVFAPPLAPGSAGLADSVAAAIADSVNAGKMAPFPIAVWLGRHGLCAVAENPRDVAPLTEELEHLAQVQLLCLKSGAGLS